MNDRKPYHFFFAFLGVVIIFGAILEATNDLSRSILSLSLGISIIFYMFADVDLSHNDERTQMIKMKSGFLSYIIGLVSVGVVYLLSFRFHLISSEVCILIALSIFIISYPMILFLYSRLL